MSGKPAARQGDMTQYGGSIVQGSAGVRIGAPTGVACSVCPGGVTSGHPVNPCSVQRSFPVKPTSPCPARCRSSSPHLQQLPDKNARAGGEPRPRLENACGYPLTAAR